MRGKSSWNKGSPGCTSIVVGEEGESEIGKREEKRKVKEERKRMKGRGERRGKNRDAERAYKIRKRRIDYEGETDC